MVTIDLLAEHLESIPTLTDWFRAQWPDYYATRTTADIAQDFADEANRDRLPVRLVAFVDETLAGTVVLRDEAISSLPGYHPGLGGLLVAEQFRGRGIGTELVKAGMKTAHELGYASAYTTTVNARGIVERLGWQLVQEISHNDEQLLLYRCTVTELSI